ncbi:MAG TPA: hypothetical protein VF952_08290 [Chloroflexia bacterium]|jgi:hypothetical protein
MRLTKLLAISLLSGLALFGSLPATPAAACECPEGEGTVQGAFTHAEVVFSGKVVAGPDDPRTGGKGALLEVLTLWKGDSSRTTWVVDAPFCMMDAASYYRVGESYLIYGGYSVFSEVTRAVLQPLPSGRSGPLSRERTRADMAVLDRLTRLSGSTEGSLPASGQATEDQGIKWSLLAALCLGTGLALVAKHKKQVRT